MRMKESMKSASFQTPKSEQIFIWQLRYKERAGKYRCPETAHIAAAF